MEVFACQVGEDVDERPAPPLQMNAKRLQPLSVGTEPCVQFERAARPAVERVLGGGEIKDEFG